jgi:hypothetical protein
MRNWLLDAQFMANTFLVDELETRIDDTNAILDRFPRLEVGKGSVLITDYARYTDRCCQCS